MMLQHLHMIMLRVTACFLLECPMVFVPLHPHLLMFQLLAIHMP